MTTSLIGRKEEIHTLKEMLSSHQAEFLAIYGRRRVGKTFLIRSFFEKQKVIFFDVMGSKGGSLRDQVKHFMTQIGKVFYQGVALKPSKNWDEAFKVLTQAMESAENSKKIILFFDEFPWMDTKMDG